MLFIGIIYGDNMPAGYERMRDKFIAQGMSKKAAQRKAARIWNSKNPDNPVGRHKKKRLSLKRAKARHKWRK